MNVTLEEVDAALDDEDVIAEAFEAAEEACGRVFKKHGRDYLLEAF